MPFFSVETVFSSSSSSFSCLRENKREREEAPPVFSPGEQSRDSRPVTNSWSVDDAPISSQMKENLVYSLLLLYSI